MHFARNIASALVGAMLVAMAGCATTTTTRPTGLSQSAEQLDMNARTLAAHSDYIGPPHQSDAHDLAKRAYDFRSMVNTATVSSSEVQAQFQLVSESYHKLQADVEHTRTQQAYSDMEPVTAAYHAVEHDMGVSRSAETAH